MRAEEILSTLAYFDVFNYPLTSSEIYDFSNLSKDEAHTLNETLHQLASIGVVEHYKDFYALAAIEKKVEKRLAGNAKAIKQLKIAQRIAKLISFFPYVVGVGLSGSLSKNYADEQSDIDFFIITRPNRLWICRTILILFKKVFLLNSYKYFCLNYFVDSENLSIAEKNIYTAVEIETLVPLVNQKIFDVLLAENKWTNEYLPHAKHLVTATCHEPSFFIPHFNSNILNRIDSWLMKNTIRFWQKKFKGFNQERFQKAFKASKQISTHHPGDFQFNILKQFELKRSLALEKLESLSVSKQ